MDSPNLSTLPTPLHWQNTALRWHIADNTDLTIVAGAATDLFMDPQGKVKLNNAPRLVFKPDGHYLLSARVSVDFTATYDAGVLVIYDNEKRWAKLCFEQSPQGQPTIVSVVNRDCSDDCNSIPMNSNQTYLRIARLDGAYAFHASADGRVWSLIRYFALGESAGVEVGFSAQSPTGESCSVTFDSIRYEARKLEDIRSGE